MTEHKDEKGEFKRGDYTMPIVFGKV